MKLQIFILIIALSSALKCKTDTDCSLLNTCINKVCEHKDLLPLAPTEWVGAFCLLGLAIVASAGGVGGSVVCTSISLLLFYIDTHVATAIVQAYVFAGAFTAVILKFRDRHPNLNRPLIYYDIVMLLVSPLLLGVTIGVILNPMFPAWLILALLTLLVLYLCWDVSTQGVRLYKRESAARRTEALQNNNLSQEEQAKLDASPEKKEPEERIPAEVLLNPVDDPKADLQRVINEENNDRRTRDATRFSNVDKEQLVEETPEKPLEQQNPYPEETTDSAVQDKISSIYRTESQLISYWHMSYFLVLISFSILIALLRGSSSTSSIAGVTSCTGSYNAIIVTYVAVMVILAIISALYLIRKNDICVRGKYKFGHDDLKWTRILCLKICLGGVAIGILVGLLGLGGGYIIGPIFLRLGLRPEISTISSSFLISISSFTALMQYVAFGVLDYKYTILYFVASIIGALIGVLFLRKYAIKRKRASVLVLVLCATIMIAVFVIPGVGIYNAVQQSINGNFQLGFMKMC
jgi:uncharacterized membrane protein YfcA